jgi:hypothetical protein
MDKTYKIVLITGYDGTGKNKLINSLISSMKDVVEFNAAKFRDRDPIYLYASESDTAELLQRRFYQNNNHIKQMWVELDGIHVDVNITYDTEDIVLPHKLTELTIYEQYTILLSYFLLEHIKHKGRTIVIRDFALGGDDFKILDFLDTIRLLIMDFGLNFILSTNVSKNAALAKRKFSFLEEEFLVKDTAEC